MSATDSIKKTAAKTTATEKPKNKRIAVCLDCGYEWEARNPNLPKPPRCSQCGNKKNIAWKDELSGEELKEIFPLLHGLKEKINELFVTPNEDDDKKKEKLPANKYAAVPWGTASTGLKQNKPIKTTAETEDDSRDQKPKEVYIPELKETVPLIDNINQEEETDDGVKNIPHVAWENKDGEIEYGAIVNKDTADEVTTILNEKEEEKKEEEQAKPTIKDIDVLKAAGLLTENEAIPFEKGPKDEPKTEETETTPEEEEPTEKKGIPLGVALALGGVIVFIGINIVKAYKATATAKQNKNNRQGETENDEEIAQTNAHNVLYGDYPENYRYQPIRAGPVLIGGNLTGSRNSI